jgi:hypothetical protein
MNDILTNILYVLAGLGIGITFAYFVHQDELENGEANLIRVVYNALFRK